MTRLPHVLLAAFLLGLTPSTGTAQTVPSSLDYWLQRTLDSMIIVLNAKGLGAAVQLPTGAVWVGGAGISSLPPFAQPDSISTADLFGIGSVNKTITAGCILQMADEGKLSIDDPLHKWLDTFPQINPNITLRQLMRHQSGIYDILSNPALQPTIYADQDSVWKWEDAIRTFIKAPVFQPGASWSYCNTNYLLLGLIIEKVSGKPYHEEIRNRFLTPLGLQSTMIPPYETYPPDVAHVWLDLTGTGTATDQHALFSNWKAWHSTAAPAGSYFSTPADMARWMRAYMSGTLLTPATMTAMKTTVTSALQGGTRYGLGIMDRSIFGLKAYGHGGDAGYSASVWYFPNKDISIAVLNNDGRRNSWALLPTVTALLRMYLKFEATVSVYQALTPEQLDISAFPNPFSEKLNITSTLPAGASELRFVLTNSLGQPVAETVTTQAASGPQQFQLGDLDRLPAGLYFLTSYLDGRLVASSTMVRH